VHRRRHYWRKSILVGEINCRSGIEKPACRFPILLRRRDQQWRPALPVAAVWIDAFHQTLIDERIALNRDGPHQFVRGNADAGRRFRPDGDCPQNNQNQGYKARWEDKSPVKDAHVDGRAANYMILVKESATPATELRVRL
jgi:hypothetical protein